MPRTPALGRGLAALIEPSDRTAGVERRLANIDLDAIVPNRRQPRTAFDDAALAALATSITNDGLLQPLIVRPDGGGRFELIAGERRWRAARLAGLRTVPAIIRDADDRDKLVLALVENIVRDDLNAIDVARGYGALVDEFGLSAAAIADRVGRSRTAVANTLRLLALPDDVIALIERGDLSEGHGRAILALDDDDDRRALARRAVAEGLSVRVVERLAAARPAVRPAPASRAGWLHDDTVADIVDVAYRAFGAPARLRQSASGARLEIEIGSSRDLDRIRHVLEQMESPGP